MPEGIITKTQNQNMIKHLFVTLLAVSASLGVSAQNWKKGNPNNAEHAYLEQYKNLKEYIDREKYPNFRAGLALGAADYNSGGTVKAIADANFDELVTGNAMKMASCVSGTGTMNFTTVKNFVQKATAAGHTVYGHTLAWHAQQPRGWLLSLMKDHPAQPIEGADTEVYQEFHTKDFRTQQNIGWHADYTENNYSVSFDETDGMKVTVTKKAKENYYVQYLAATDIPTEKSKKYKMIMTVKGSAAGSMYARIGDWGGGPSTTIKFTTEWQDVEWNFTNTIANPFLLLQHGSFVGDIWIKNVRFEEVVMGKTVNEDRRCLVIDAAANDASGNGLGTGESQLRIKTGDFAAGSSYKFSALVRADKRATVSTLSNTDATNPIGEILFTNNWTKVTSQGTLSTKGSQIFLLLSTLEEANKFYFDDVSLVINGTECIVNGDFEGTEVSSFLVRQGTKRPAAASITENISYLLLPTPTPLTAEEKHDTLVYAMDKWIKGMMEACDGKVKAWDLANEAISGGDSDGDGVYDLQHDWEMKSDGDFFWQDFMGDLEYVRQAVRLARKYGPEDLNLFINDYNLESDWDDNGKVKSLVKWIERWEADGVTKIDGIGSQMHISCSMNPRTLASRRQHIRQMFEIMAASGKKVRVSELDMGMDDANGKGLKTSELTEEMHQMMADHYEFILKTFFEVVPVEQQWGICQWCMTDSPTNSGWRADTPVGLWTLNTYYRKPTYAGWVRGLAGCDPIATSIESAEATQHSALSTQDSPLYNLSGQKVDSNYRGIVIRNGKKVMIK